MTTIFFHFLTILLLLFIKFITVWLNLTIVNSLMFVTPINKIHLIKQNQNCFLFWGPNFSQRRPENEEWLLLFSSFFGLGNRNPSISSNWIGGNQELRGNENNCIAKLNLNLICKKSKSKVHYFCTFCRLSFCPISI